MRKEDERHNVDAIQFSRFVNIPMYLSSTRLDITFSSSIISRFMVDPHENNMRKTKRIL